MPGIIREIQNIEKDIPYWIMQCEKCYEEAKLIFKQYKEQGIPVRMILRAKNLYGIYLIEVKSNG